MDQPIKKIRRGLLLAIVAVGVTIFAFGVVRALFFPPEVPGFSEDKAESGKTPETDGTARPDTNPEDGQDIKGDITDAHFYIHDPETRRLKWEALSDKATEIGNEKFAIENGRLFLYSIRTGDDAGDEPSWSATVIKAPTAVIEQEKWMQLTGGVDIERLEDIEISNGDPVIMENGFPTGTSVLTAHTETLECDLVDRRFWTSDKVVIRRDVSATRPGLLATGIGFEGDAKGEQYRLLRSVRAEVALAGDAQPYLAESDGPLTISGDELRGYIGTLEENACIRYGSRKLSAGRISFVAHTPEDRNEPILDSVSAEGNVVLAGKEGESELNARGVDKLEYLAAGRILRLWASPSENSLDTVNLEFGDNSIRSRAIELDVGNRTVTAEGNVSFSIDMAKRKMPNRVNEDGSTDGLGDFFGGTIEGSADKVTVKWANREIEREGDSGEDPAAGPDRELVSIELVGNVKLESDPWRAGGGEVFLDIVAGKGALSGEPATIERPGFGISAVSIEFNLEREFSAKGEVRIIASGGTLEAEEVNAFGLKEGETAVIECGSCRVKFEPGNDDVNRAEFKDGVAAFLPRGDLKGDRLEYDRGDIKVSGTPAVVSGAEDGIELSGRDITLTEENSTVRAIGGARIDYESEATGETSNLSADTIAIRRDDAGRPQFVEASGDVRFAGSGDIIGRGALLTARIVYETVRGEDESAPDEAVPIIREGSLVGGESQAEVSWRTGTIRAARIDFSGSRLTASGDKDGFAEVYIREFDLLVSGIEGGSRDETSEFESIQKGSSAVVLRSRSFEVEFGEKREITAFHADGKVFVDGVAVRKADDSAAESGEEHVQIEGESLGWDSATDVLRIAGDKAVLRDEIRRVYIRGTVIVFNRATGKCEISEPMYGMVSEDGRTIRGSARKGQVVIEIGSREVKSLRLFREVYFEGMEATATGDELFWNADTGLGKLTASESVKGTYRSGQFSCDRICFRFLPKSSSETAEQTKPLLELIGSVHASLKPSEMVKTRD